MSELAVPPTSDELEVSVFGPGVGESIVVHLGHGDWMVVDSCLNPRTRRPAALEYLETLDVDVGSAVRLLVLTHWHDDHVRGAGQILEQAKAAQVVCSAKDHGPALFEAVETARAARLPATGLDEMAQIFGNLLRRAQRDQRRQSVGPMWAVEGRLLFHRDAGSSGRPPVRVMALSPSDGTLTLAMHELRQFLPRPAGPERRAVRLTPNERSVVVFAQAGTRAILLGADLEETHNPATGWSAVVDSPVRPAARSEIFKVPHHGAVGADNEAVWQEMLAEGPIACVTPFSRGRSPLPTPKDLRRLHQRTRHVFCTRGARGPRPRRRPAPVERTIREVARRRRSIEGPMGHIRVRGSLSDRLPLGVELFGVAFKASP